jgi:hypothetical protein
MTDWVTVWSEIAYVLLRRGCVPVDGVEFWAHEDGVPLRLIRRAAAKLGVEEFENGGQRYWRLSGKVVPILPRAFRDCSYRQAGAA